MGSPNVYVKIREIRKRVCAGPSKSIMGALHEFLIGCDENRLIVYMSAEVWPDSLDNGEELTPAAQQAVKRKGTKDDRPAQIIGKRLGGSGTPNNAFPLNTTLDTSGWEADEAKVYDHVKQGDNRHAYLMYGIEYEDEKEKHANVLRPQRIYYHFKLFEDGKSFGLPISNVFENLGERFTNPNFFSSPFGPCNPYFKK